MSDVAQQIVHESETQRQHVRVHLPAQIEFANKSYDVSDLSAGGLSVRNVEGSFAKLQHISFVLILPFTDLKLYINLDAQVQYHDAANKKNWRELY